MMPYLSYENYKACAENGFDVLKMAIKQGWDISSEVIKDIVNENIFKPDSTCFIWDEGYDDFDSRNGCTIYKYYVICVDGKYYQFWEQVVFTEMPESYFYDQSFLEVRQERIEVTIWKGVE